MLNKIRIFLKDPEVMIFDEPTAFLDKEGCDIFFKNICKIKSNKIIIIISHDLKAIKICDKILELL